MVDTWRIRRVLGVSRGYLRGATERHPGGLPARDTWLIRAHPGWSHGTRGLLGGLPDVVYGLGTRGHVSLSENFRRVCCLGFGTQYRWRARATSGGILPAWGI